MAWPCFICSDLSSFWLIQRCQFVNTIFHGWIDIGWKCWCLPISSCIAKHWFIKGRPLPTVVEVITLDVADQTHGVLGSYSAFFLCKNTTTSCQEWQTESWLIFHGNFVGDNPCQLLPGIFVPSRVPNTTYIQWAFMFRYVVWFNQHYNILQRYIKDCVFSGMQSTPISHLSVKSFINTSNTDIHVYKHQTYNINIPTWYMSIWISNHECPISHWISSPLKP